MGSDGRLLLFRELDDALGPTKMAAWELRDRRTGRNSHHELAAMFRQSLFGRIAGYEDVNDAGRLARDPVMRLVAEGRDFNRFAASESPVQGSQEGSAYNGHFGCSCYHPLFVFNQHGDLERCALRPDKVHSAHDWHAVLDPLMKRYHWTGLF